MTSRPDRATSIKPSATQRIPSLDGLRGIASLIVVIFHFMAMLYPWYVPDYNDSPPFLVDTPVSLFWNGPFAVSVFFVLSGFVMAAAAERKHYQVLTNIITRYFRLAIPVVASVSLAFFWLHTFPRETLELRETISEPSAWLRYTVQEPLPSWKAFLYHGAVGNFVSGDSRINNVLWTMQIELVGSIALFLVYWVGGLGMKYRYAALFIFGLVSILFMRDAFVCFVTGAIVYEMNKHNLFQKVPAIIVLFIFLIGVMLGFPGQGFSDRIGLGVLNERFQPGFVNGLIPPLAATFILIASIRLPSLARVLSLPFHVWLGRISFGLYLVHVPILYTVVAWAYINHDISLLLLFIAYLTFTLLIAYVFTVVVDEPSLRFLKSSRKYRDYLELKWNRLPFRFP